MSKAETQDSSQPEGTVSPETPSVPDSEPQNPAGQTKEAYEPEVIDSYDVPNLDGSEDYDANILHLSDSELDEPYDDIVEEFEEDEIDYVVNSGDNFKLPPQVVSFDDDDNYEPEDFEEDLIDEYIDGQVSHFEGMSKIKDELEVEIGDLPGNHDHVYGSHPTNDADAFKKAVEERAEERFEEYEGENNLREFLIEDYDVKDLENDYVDIGDLRIVGASHGVEPEIEEKYLEEPELEEIYEGEELENIVETMEESQEPDYGILGSIPVVGSVVEYVGSLFGHGDIGLDAEELELKEIPEDLRNDEHENYLDEKEDAMETFEEVREPIEPMIEGHDGPVVLAGHQDILGEYGSIAQRSLVEEYDNVVAHVGGHNHENMVEEYEESVAVNSAETYSKLGVGDEVHVNQYGPGGMTDEEIVSESANVISTMLPEIPGDQSEQIAKDLTKRGLMPNEVPGFVNQQMSQQEAANKEEQPQPEAESQSEAAA
ncbi:MAG: hypothetical protein H8Z69_04770 [Nanohaloarchaea archaeon]|nr:hypothetical protein [Candidatus Nanohaloarchaea archaeon]